MKKFIPALLVIGLMFSGCGPTEEEIKVKEEQIEVDSEEAKDDIMKMAEEALEEIELDTAVLVELVDSLEAEAEVEDEVEGE